MLNLVKATVFLSVTAASSIAIADVFDRYQSYKDAGPSVHYYNAPTSYRSEPRHGIRRWLDDRDMSLARCLKNNAERRRAGREGRDCAAIMLKSRKQAYYGRLSDGDPRPTRYAASRYPRYDAEPSRRCMAPIKVTGVERTLRWRAEESARKAWRREAIDQHGYRYSGGFQEVRVTCDNIRGYVFICRASGRPCRED